MAYNTRVYQLGRVLSADTLKVAGIFGRPLPKFNRSRFSEKSTKSLVRVVGTR